MEGATDREGCWGRWRGKRGIDLIENYIHKGNQGSIDIGLSGKWAKGRGTLNIRELKERAGADAERWFERFERV